MLTPVEILRAARALIADPARWTQGEDARDACGSPAWAGRHASSAVCWSADGALMHVERDKNSFWPARDALVAAMGASAVVFNDTHTHAEVLAAFDRAIALAEARS